MGTHLIGLGKSFPMNTNMAGFKSFSKKICFLVSLMKVASALKGFSVKYTCNILMKIWFKDLLFISMKCLDLWSLHQAAMFTLQTSVTDSKGKGYKTPHS